jgi:hypothetical protein
MKINRKIICSFIFVVFLAMITGTVAGAALAPEVNMELVGHLGGSIGAISVVGNYAYVGQGQDVLIQDITNPSSPTLLGKIMTNDYVNDIKVSGNYAYVTNSNNLLIIDINNPSTPTIKGSCNAIGAIGVSVSNNYAYVITYDGLSIIDISNSSSPTLKGNYHNPLNNHGSVSVSGNYAYIGGPSSLEIVDISNPSSPTLTGSYKTSMGTYCSSVSGNYAYIGESKGLEIVDISNPSSPILKGMYNTSNYVSSVSVSGNYVYIISFHLTIIDISNPSSPTLKINYLVGSGSKIVSVSGNYAYISDYSSGLKIVDISNPSSPTLKWSDKTSMIPYHISVSGNYAYVATNDRGHNLTIIDISNPSSPYLKGIYTTNGNQFGLTVSGKYAYTADNIKGLLIIDISNPSSPTLKGKYRYVNSTDNCDVSVSGNYAYVTVSDGLIIVDISNPSSPTLKGSYKTAGRTYRVSVSGNYAYVTEPYNGLLIIDISNPSSPTLKGSYKTVGSAYGVSVSGNYAYVRDTDSDNGNDGNSIDIIDISNPSSPFLAGSYKTGWSGYDVSVSGNYAYFGDFYHNFYLDIIDVSNPYSPLPTGSYRTASQVGGVSISGNYTYVADGENGLVILKTDIQNQISTDVSLVQVESSSDVYLIKDGIKHHFTSPEALEWNGYSFDDVTSVTSETLQQYPDGEDISISQPIIDKYHALGGAPIFGASSGEGEKIGDQDSAGIYCSYVNFENGAIECFKEGDLTGKAYAIFNPFYTKWASMGYAKSVLGYPIDNMSNEETSKFGTKFRYQNFANGTEKGALEYNITSGNVFEIHGAIFAKWNALGYAQSDLGHPVMNQEERNGYEYCEFEGGIIYWDEATGDYIVKTDIQNPMPTDELEKLQNDLNDVSKDTTHMYPVTEADIQNYINQGYNQSEINKKLQETMVSEKQGRVLGSYIDAAETQQQKEEIQAIINEQKDNPDEAVKEINDYANKNMANPSGYMDSVEEKFYSEGLASIIGVSTSLLKLSENVYAKVASTMGGIYGFAKDLHTEQEFEQEMYNSDNYVSTDDANALAETSRIAIALANLDPTGYYSDIVVETTGRAMRVARVMQSQKVSLPRNYKTNEEWKYVWADVEAAGGILVGNEYFDEDESVYVSDTGGLARIYRTISDTAYESDRFYIYIKGQPREDWWGKICNSRESGHWREVEEYSDGKWRIVSSSSSVSNAATYLAGALIISASAEPNTLIEANPLKIYNISSQDLDGDGNAEVICLDTTGNGEPNIFYYDLNKDGLFEIQKYVNANNITITGYDITEDGKTDAYDMNGDENCDAWDLDGNGRIDQIDLDYDGRVDAYDSNNNGYLDIFIDYDHEIVSWINSPVYGETFLQGEHVLLNGSVYDGAKKAIPPYTFTWSSDIDGLIGKGENISLSNLSLGNHTITLTVEDNNGSIDERDVSITISRGGSLSVTDLESTNGTSWINWTWTNPTDPDFNHNEIYLNGAFKTNTSAEYFNATGLQPITSYTISTRTVDNSKNVNEIWVNSTATTAAELLSDSEKPVIGSVVLFPANTTAGATISLSINATDDIDVTEVTASDTLLTKTDGFWQGSITAPSSVGGYSLSIKAKDAAGNTAETSMPYRVVQLEGGASISVSPRYSNVTAGSTVPLTIKVKNTQNIDDSFKVNISVGELPASYQANLTWFDWTEQNIKLRAGEEVLLPIKVNGSAGTATGRKLFRANVMSDTSSITGLDTGYLTVK